MAPASEVAVEQTVEGKDGSGSASAAAHAAPARGDAAGEAAGSATLWLDSGQRVLSRARSGAGTGWVQRDAAAPAEFGVSAPLSPFAVAALLADADAAAPADCPLGLDAERCFTAVVATADPSEPLAVDAALAHRAGLPWPILDAGIDTEGRPVFVRVAQRASALGKPYAVLTSVARFTAYPDAPPPPPVEPDAASVNAGEEAR